jgi:hypothetical protein
MPLGSADAAATVSIALAMLVLAVAALDVLHNTRRR